MALHLADLYNWSDATPLFIQAERAFIESGDREKALYAHIGRLRTGSRKAVVLRSKEIADLLALKGGQRLDPQLRLFALCVKGDLDGEIDSKAARQDWIDVIKLAQELRVSKWSYRAEGQIGFADYYDGDIVSSQHRVASALIAATAANDIGAEIFFLSTTANGFALQGMPEQAVGYASKAIAIAKENPEAGFPGIAYFVISGCYVTLGDLGKAEQTFQESWAAARNPVAKGNALFVASKISKAKGDVAGAIKNLQAAIAVTKTYGEYRAEASWESELSRLYLAEKNLPEAESLARMAAASLEGDKTSLRVAPDYLNRLNTLAQVMTERNKYREANQIYERAGVFLDTMVGEADSVVLKRALISGANDLYSNHFALIADHFSHSAAAFNIVEHARGRALADLLASGKATSPEARQKEAEISNLRLQLAKVHTSAGVRKIRDAIFMAEQSRSVNPDITILNTRRFQPVQILTIQNDLSDSEVVLEYVLGEPSSYCFVITKEGSRIVRLRSKREIQLLVGKYLSRLKEKQPIEAEGIALYNFLLSPIEETGFKPNLVIVPDGSLHLLPFEALVDNSHRYVVESKVVLYAPSCTTYHLLKMQSRTRPGSKQLLAVGAVPYGNSNISTLGALREPGQISWNLPGSRAEVIAAANALGGKTDTLLTDGAATETAFKQAAKTPYRFIHFAVHATNSDNPDRSALLLLSDPARGEDGFLQASEIVQMSLRTSLVVLSACDTAIGPIDGEEGSSTLSNAFLLAGANSVAATLWTVEDEAASFLMKRFYQQLAQQRSPADSLAEAKREVLKTFGPHLEPLHWAGFIVEGSDVLSH